MTSTLGINDSQPRNLEAPRSAELIPDQVRVSATMFLTLLNEYYKFMNLNEWATVQTSTPTTTVLSGKSGSGPSNIIYSILSELDIDQVSADYLSHIQATIAPLVPIPAYMSPDNVQAQNAAPFYKIIGANEEKLSALRALFYQKIVKYFYNTRGSRNSAVSFFQLFYNDTASVYDYNDTTANYIGQIFIQPWLTTSGMSLASTTVSAGSRVYGQTPIQAWTPFSYVITTSIDEADFSASYRALVHPVGFKYFVQYTDSSNTALEVSPSRMVNARYDYQNALWFLDSATLAEYANWIISDATEDYVQSNQNTTAYTYADWSNVGSIVAFKVPLTSTASIGTYTLSISTLSALNISPGMTVIGTTSFGSYSSAMIGYSSASVNTVSGQVTLITTLSSTISSGSTITFLA